jgi:hypothetical protein
MNLKLGLVWFKDHLRWLVLASVLVALLGPSPSHEAGFTFTLPIGLLLFLVESPSGFKIVATLFVIYTCLSFLLLAALAVIWGSLRTTRNPQ